MKIMKKPWSITTTLRNPERLRDFLIVLKQLENCKWNLENQKKYQILLIKERLYGYGNNQFYKGISQDNIDLIDNPQKDISFDKAEEIFESKKYEDSPMRGRQSINPLKKFGFAIIKNGKIVITDLGRLFLDEKFDIGEIFFKSFLKWQIPNPESDDYSYEEGYNIKPFIGVLHLIRSVNEKYSAIGKSEKGISRSEFSLFCPTLINYKDINSYAERIISLRKKLEGKSNQKKIDIFNQYRGEFATEFLGTSSNKEINKLLNNLKDYGDNALRYFRLTRYIYIRGGGYYIDLEPRRSIEIKKLLNLDNAKSQIFESTEYYHNYISDNSKPELPWENIKELSEISNKLLEEIILLEKRLKMPLKSFPDLKKLDKENIKKLIDDLRAYRRELQEKENYLKSQEVEQIKKYIEELKNINKFDNKSILLEKLISLGLNALNDAIEIKPNYPVGDDNEPTFTAPGNMPDIECFYGQYNAVCEVTMLTGRNQWYYEGQPVMRHLRDFENKHNDKNTFCLFIAPKIHRDTINTFWMAIKYEYEGKKQRIIPLSIDNFIELLKILIEIKQNGNFLKHDELFRLYSNVLEKSETMSNSDQWLKDIPKIFTSWKKSLNLT
jgi:hypothetical protein